MAPPRRELLPWWRQQINRDGFWAGYVAAFATFIVLQLIALFVIWKWPY